MSSVTVRPGDSMWAIAQRLNVTLQSLIDANPQVQDPNVIYSGQELEIPGARDDFEAAPVEQAPVAPAPEPEPPQAPPPVAQDGQVVVEPGDSLSAIAARNGVSLGALVQANPQIADPNVIYPGQLINVPGAAPAPVPETPAEPVTPEEPELPASTYTVRSGDTLSGIAGRAGVSLADLLRANPDIRNPNIIYPGQQIQIPSGGSVPAPRAPVTTGGISPGGDPSANPYYADFVRAAETAGVPTEWASNPALIQLVRHESGFRPDAKNPTSSAFGMFQFLDSTWSSYLREVPYGSQDPYWQAVGGFRYIQQRYGTPERAWAFWQSTVNRDPSIAPPDLRSQSQYWIDHNYGGY